MAERAVPRVTRLLGIISFVESEGEASFDELAERFGVSREQIQRDVELLWVSGVPGHAPEDLIDFDAWAYEDGVARLINSLGMGQVRLSAREAVALMAALASVTATGAAPQAVHSALDKLRAAVGDDAAITTVRADAVDQSVSSAVRSAVEQGHVVRVDYVDAHDRLTTRDIEPHRLVAIDGALYVECFCRRAQDYRTLRVSRIATAAMLEDAVVQPPHSERGFILEPQYEATVSAARRALWLLEAIPGATIDGDQDVVTATFGVANPASIARQLLSIGPHLRDVQPQALRDEVAAQARAVIQAQA